MHIYTQRRVEEFELATTVNTPIDFHQSLWDSLSVSFSQLSHQGYPRSSKEKGHPELMLTYVSMDDTSTLWDFYRTH